MYTYTESRSNLGTAGGSGKREPLHCRESAKPSKSTFGQKWYFCTITSARKRRIYPVIFKSQRCIDSEISSSKSMLKNTKWGEQTGKTKQVPVVFFSWILWTYSSWHDDVTIRNKLTKTSKSIDQWKIAVKMNKDQSALRMLCSSDAKMAAVDCTSLLTSWKSRTAHAMKV